MSYYPIGHRVTGDDGDDFHELDPATFGGGYDISLTYGRGIPPSLETCYPHTSCASNYFDYGHPQYTSRAKPSAYASEALDNEYRSYARPKPREGLPMSADWHGYSGPRPNFGFQPGSGVPEGFGSTEHGRLESEHGSAYGRKPASSEFESQHHGRMPEYEGFSDYGHGGRPERADYGVEKPIHPMPSYPQPPIHSAPNYPPPPIFSAPNYPPPPVFPMPGYPEPIYPENHRNPSYERRDVERYPGVKNYGDHDHSDEEEKRRRHHHHHW